jgi:Protein of unknown function (DUF3072)
MRGALTPASKSSSLPNEKRGATTEPRQAQRQSTELALDLLFLRRMTTIPPNDQPALQKNPDDWKTGDEPMTAAQRSYLETLAQDAGESFEEEELTKAEASKRIEELRERSPRIAGE